MNDDLEIPSMDGGTKDSLRAERDTARAEVVALREALALIANDPHCVSPEHHTANSRDYEIGVSDGHRCAAEKARAALKETK